MGAYQNIGFAPMPAVARVLAGFEREQLAGFVEVAIGLLDLGDDHEDVPDFRPRSDGMPGDPVDHEKGGDEEQAAYVEWTSMRRSQKGGPNILAGQEDDEEDDPSGQCDEDGINTAFGDVCYTSGASGAGCSLSDPGGCQHDGREPDCDEEREQMVGDVPMLPVFSYEHNVFSDARVSLGIGNLQSSYRTNGGVVVSADSGRAFTSRHSIDLRVPGGVPV